MTFSYRKKLKAESTTEKSKEVLSEVKYLYKRIKSARNGNYPVEYTTFSLII